MVTESEQQRYAELQQMALDAARQGDAEMLRPMLEAGMPVELKDGKGNTLLMLAAYHGNAGTVALLLEKGAEPDVRNDRDQTPLAGVAFKGHLDVARVLLKAGADPLADQGGGKTPVMFAAMFGHPEMVALLERSATPSGKRKAWLGWLARLMAIPRALFFRRPLRPFVVGH
ncbi:ankyrin repeat domain-containing protein [Luteolibacter arcticus]|uniref:Ankyrin repeat domain-containing protein n=1 Tax=Luteolibacter arcticus TaxID=1581411 RepID=A0ABT3GED1_9BACT|nr:ankyrin repeat domain-containing protein [Luteolibacter arcticus]MCW1921974.1 ankyrin repeat domain-containing protein [Luteolibacter arcticus]